MESPISTQTINAPVKQAIDRKPFATRFKHLNTEYQKWVPTWKELSVWQNPTRGFFFNQAPNSGQKINHSTLIDSYARRCIRDFASGMLSGLTSPSRPWFRLELEDSDLMKYGPVKAYLDECTKRMHAVFSSSNIYECLYIAYEELATFGTAAVYIGEDYQDILRGRAFTIGEYFLGNGPDNRCNTWARQFWMTVGQVVKEFGLEACSVDTKKSFAAHETEKYIKIIWMIEENDERIEDYIDWKNMKYRSIYWEDSTEPKTSLRTEGYNEFPILAPRWATTTSADSYGKSSGWDTLGDVKQLQKEQSDKLLGIAKKTNPPVQADASVQNVNTLPGGLTRSSATTPNAGIREAYQVTLDLNAIREDILELKKSLDDAYYRDLFKGILLIEKSGTTATEIAEKKAEQLNLASPLILRVTNEVGNPLIGLSFSKLNALGVLPPPPQEIQGMPIKIKYVSVLAQAQRLIGISAIDQWTQSVFGDAAFLPEALDIINVDEKNQEKAEMFGIPSKIVNSPEVLAQKRQARADAQAAQAKAEQMNQATIIAGQGAKAMKDASQAKLGEGSALDKMSTMMPGGGK